MNRRLVRDALKMLCWKYVSDNKDSIANLSTYKFSYSVFVYLSGKPGWDKEIMEDGDLMGAIVDELESRGYVVQRSQFFYLTEKGLKAGTNNMFQKTMGWLNANPGLAIVISFISLVVSIAALYLSTRGR